jgi:hypothetical protein
MTLTERQNRSRPSLSSGLRATSQQAPQRKLPLMVVVLMRSPGRCDRAQLSPAPSACGGCERRLPGTGLALFKVAVQTVGDQIREHQMLGGELRLRVLELHQRGGLAVLGGVEIHTRGDALGQLDVPQRIGHAAVQQHRRLPVKPEERILKHAEATKRLHIMPKLQPRVARACDANLFGQPVLTLIHECQGVRRAQTFVQHDTVREGQQRMNACNDVVETFPIFLGGCRAIADS